MKKTYIQPAVLVIATDGGQLLTDSQPDLSTLLILDLTDDNLVTDEDDIH